MKRFKKVCLSLLFLLLIGGCQPSKNRLSEWLKDGDRVKVLSTTAQIGDLVKAVGGERVDDWVLIQGDLDPHSYEMVKGDGEKLGRADLVFYNGLGLEHGASLSAWLNTSSKAVAVGERIRAAVPERMIQRGKVVDPHIWMDISLWQKGIDPVVESLIEIDPAGASLYRERGEALRQQMEQADGEIRAILQQVPAERRYLVTSHDAFHYFTRRYLAEADEVNWESRFAAPEGLAPEGQLSPRDIQKTIDFLREKKIGVLFSESNVSRDAIRKIATAGREMGLEIEIAPAPLYGDAMSGLTYLEMMRHNAETIAKHL